MTWKRLAAPILAMLALPLSACAGPAVAVLPEGVAVAVFQNRLDYAIRQLEIKVSNGTDATITVTRAALESTRFAAPAVWDRPQDIPAGAARDLKVLLADPVCGHAEPDNTVVLDFTLADGTTGTANLEPADETGRIEAVNAEDCLGVSVAERATITGPQVAQWTPGAHEPAIVDISVVPTGAAGTLTIHQGKGTVLLALVDEAGAPITVLPVDLVLDAGAAASVIRLRIVPNRCDPHAVAEDKRGTFFPLDVETDDGRSGTIYVPMSDEVRASLYAFFGDYCDLPGGA